ncbi:hypothetical protein P5666_22795 [Bacillus subtilis]
MTMYYYSRNMDNMDNINKLADNTKAAAKKLLAYAEKNKIGVLIYGTIRTEAQQRQNVNKGVSQTMKSYHLVGQALDFVQLVAILNLILNGTAMVLQISRNLLLMPSRLDLNGEETGKVLWISHTFNLTTKVTVQIPLERKHLLPQ